MSYIVRAKNLYVNHKTHYGPGAQSVLRALLFANMSSPEIADLIGMKPKTAAARCTELARMGLVKTIDMRIANRQRSRVLTLTAKGRKRAQKV